MPKGNETTTKFKADISELKKQFQEAQRTIRVANSEFKAATAGMDKWSDSADGLSAKIKQLNSVLGAEKQKLESLEEQYALVAKEQGENSKGAQELLIKINNQKAAIANTEKQIRTYNSKLDDMKSATEEAGKAQEDTRTAFEKLSDTIGEQEAELKRLKSEYANVALEQGKESDEAKALASQISILSGELTENKSKLSDVEQAASEAARAADDLGDETEDAGEAAESSGGGFTILKGAIANLVADAIQWAIDKFKELATSSDQALNTLQTKTGMTSAEISKFKGEMEDLYKSNYGESLEDIADAMATVAQNSKETDPTKIKELTKQAIILRDTFDFDVNETMRAANMLIDQFGITGDEAFELIAQGAQNGLDKNGDLLDSINEYGVHYKQQGYTAEEFFNSLKNGTDAGTFSVDKLGDAMKEFGIRTKDTATTTDEGFELIGLNADTMREKFSKGGESAREATEETLKALFKMDDQVAQNQAGVDLFGTMWEDLGIEGVKALMDVNGEMDKSGQKMKEIDEIKYSDIGNQFSMLGRTIETELIKPLLERLLPTAQNIVTWVQENVPKVVEKLSEVKQFLSEISPVLAAIGTAIAGLALVGVIQNIGAIALALKGWLMSTKLMTAAQWLLNAAMSANPISLIIIGISALVAAFVVLWNKSEKFRDFWIGLWEKIKSAFDVVVSWFKENWQTLILFLMNPIAGLFKYFYEHFEGFRNVVDTVLNAVKGFFTTAFDTIKNVVDTVMKSVKEFFVNAWNGIKAVWSTVATWFSTHVITPVKNFFSPLVQWFTKLFSSIWKTITDIWNNIVGFLEGCWELIMLIFEPVADWFKDKFNTAWEAIKTIWSAVKGWFTDRWNEIKTVFKTVHTWFKNKFKDAWEEVKTIWNAVKGWFTDRWNDIKDVFSGVATWFKDKFDTAWGNIKDAFSAVGSFFSGVWEEVKKPFSTVATWFRDTFSEAWQKVKDVFSTGGKIFDGIKEGIAGTFTTVVNGIIGGINKVISVPFNAINGALRKIRDVSIAGVEPFKDKISEISIPEIPLLAKGGIIKKATKAIVGEDGEEAVVPLEKNNQGLKKIANLILSEIDKQPKPGKGGGAFGGGQSVVNNFYQTNNSPKSLSRLEIYRQSKNLLSMKGV